MQLYDIPEGYKLVPVEFLDVKKNRSNFLKRIVTSPIKLAANIVITAALVTITVKPIHDIVEAAYTASNFVSRISAFFPGSDSKPIVPNLSSTQYQGLSAEQSRNASAIITQGRAMGMSDRDIKIALMTAQQESGMIRASDPTHKDDWYWQANFGTASDSAGLFQQISSWGSLSCRLNPSCASKLFYNALQQVSNRNNMPEWEVAATVQRPAVQYRQKYQNWASQAETIMKQANQLNVADTLPTLPKPPTSFNPLQWFQPDKPNLEIKLDGLQGRTGSFLLFNRTDRLLPTGEPVYKLSVITDGKVVASFDTVSGTKTNQNRSPNAAPGSLNATPVGNWSVDPPVYGNTNNYDAVGGIWIGLEPKFSTARSAIGIHNDQNRNNATAGCIGLLSLADTQKVAQLVEDLKITELISR